jgi:hypothetical protein
MNKKDWSRRPRKKSILKLRMIRRRISSILLVEVRQNKMRTIKEL